MIRCRLLWIGFVIACAACSEDPGGDDLQPIDSGVSGRDGSERQDAEEMDAGAQDAEAQDAEAQDAEAIDAEAIDAEAIDAEPQDAEPQDAEATDAEATDAELRDGSDPDDAAALDGDAPDATDDGGLADAEPMDADVMPDGGSPDSGVVGIAALNDEFDDPATLSNWTLRDVAEGTPAQYGTLDVDTTRTDHLVIVPSQTARWLHAQTGIFLYKMVTGDFIMHVRLRAVQAADPTMEPTLMFNAGGILARDPASPTTSENWVLMTMGYQASGVGTRDASTNNANTNISSVRASTIADGEVVICRIGPNFYTYYNTPNKGAWTWTDWFVRNNMPQTLQVGIAVDADGAQPHLRAEFDWIRFAVPTQQSDCTMNIPPN
jgi:hypothetical protein